MTDLTIVTGASANHFMSLRQLLASIQQHESAVPVIIFDLGLSPTQRKQLEHHDVRTFEFARYPPYFNIDVDAGQYAWKPVIIADTMHEVGKNVLWLDAGCLLTGKLTFVRQLLAYLGIYSPRSSGTVQDWTHPTTLHKLAVTTAVRRLPNRAGGIVGVNYRNSTCRTLIDTWRECALDPAIIAPRGSSRKNHRQDQSVLSVLLNQHMHYGLLPTVPEAMYNISVHNDID